MTITSPPAETHQATPVSKAGGILRRLNIVTGLVGGIGLALVAYLLSHFLLDSSGSYFSDRVATITFIAWDLGFLVGETSATTTRCSSPARTRA